MATQLPPRRIVVAVDDSLGSTEALQWALDNMLLQPGRDVLILVNTQPPVLAYTSAHKPGFHVSQGDVSAETKRKDTAGCDLLHKYRERCEALGLLCETRVMIGDARISICEAAEQSKADAVVVGSRGHGALKRLVLGSVSEYCAHHCPMPVIIVRPNKIGQPEHAVPMD